MGIDCFLYERDKIMQIRQRLLFRTIGFFLILGLIVMGLQSVFGLDSLRSYENEKGFLREPNRALDAVYLGGSDVHAFWQPLFGWHYRGIAVWNYSIDSVSAKAIKNFLIETQKTQPQAVYIISLSTFKKQSTVTSMEDIHRTIDYLPFSFNKVNLINRLTEGSDYSGLNKLEFFFPIIRFHSRWSSLESWSFGGQDVDYKASMHTSQFRSVVEDQCNRFSYSKDRGEVPEYVAMTIAELLDYCDSKELRVLFVKVPQATDHEAQARMNTLEDYVRARGYTCLDLLEHVEDTGIDLKADFYNQNHTNVHGSLKYSRYLADYLVEQYGFEDKRGHVGWESWDEADINYMDYLSDVILPFEADSGKRDYYLKAPVLNEVSVDGTTLTLSWATSEGAVSYEVYRLCPTGDNRWYLIAQVDGQTHSYSDKNLYANTQYFYRVVPCRGTSEGNAYGNFMIQGITATTGGTQ